MSADLNLKIERKYLGKTATFINLYHPNQTFDKAIIYKVEFMWGEHHLFGESIKYPFVCHCTSLSQLKKNNSKCIIM